MASHNPIKQIESKTGLPLDKTEGDDSFYADDELDKMKNPLDAGSLPERKKDIIDNVFGSPRSGKAILVKADSNSFSLDEHAATLNKGGVGKDKKVEKKLGDPFNDDLFKDKDENMNFSIGSDIDSFSDSFAKHNEKVSKKGLAKESSDAQKKPKKEEKYKLADDPAIKKFVELTKIQLALTQGRTKVPMLEDQGRLFKPAKFNISSLEQASSLLSDFEVIKIGLPDSRLTIYP